MTPTELKQLRETLQARQQDIAGLLGVALRTYQNWEQPETSKAHRQVPAEAAEKVQCLADLMNEQDGGRLPKDLIWLQIPLREMQLEEFKRAAWQEDKSLALFIQEAIFEKLNKNHFE